MPSNVQPPHKKRKTKTFRVIDVSTTTGSHPLNVRPLGNAYFAEKSDGLSRNSQMGYFSILSEELFMEILGFVDDSKSLLALAHTSRVLYAYLFDEDLWKLHYTAKVQKLEKLGKEAPPLKWRGSWRLSVLEIAPEDLANLKLPGNLLCSDVLYRPFQCSQIDYDKLFHDLIQDEKEYRDTCMKNLEHKMPMPTIPGGHIPRLSESSLTQADFDSKWNKEPFILVNSNKSRWPQWDLKSLLERFSSVKFRQEAVQWPLSLYSEYLANNCDESPLYLFDCSSNAMKTLQKEYDVPQLFQQDLFTLFQHCRPDHAWLIIGSKRSGSTFHKDPNYTSAWNAALSGRKVWVMFPPGITPPGVSTDEEESEVTSPVGIAEWVLSGFYNEAATLPEAQIGITFPGECMYVPSGWWHMVINLDDSVALTQNFVPEVKLANALHFLKNKRNQLSGFRPLEVKQRLQEIMANFKNSGDEDMEKMSLYANKFDQLNLQEYLQTEDCGEIMSSQLPPMPVFELFKKLLILNGKEEQLEKSLEELAKIERLEHAKTTGKSEVWTQLTNESSFAFGFDGDFE